VLDSGLVVTAAHVVAGARARDIVGVDSRGEHVAFTRVVADVCRDLAVLRPAHRRPGSLRLADGREPELGAALWAWGFPFGSAGPAPLVTVGHLAGFRTVRNGRRAVRHLVVNGAFNVGNSGGPLCLHGTTDVVGVVVNKQVPLDPFVDSAITALAQQKAGPQFTAINARGSSRQFAQSELVAEVFAYYRSCLQVMLGEAVAARVVRRFIHEAEEQMRSARSSTSRRPRNDANARRSVSR
jgi:hypothetical protein